MKPTVEVELLEVGKHDGGGRRLAAAGERTRLPTMTTRDDLTPLLPVHWQPAVS